MDFIVHGKLSVAEKVLVAYMLPDFKPVGISISLKDDAGPISLVYVSNAYPPEKL